MSLIVLSPDVMQKKADRENFVRGARATAARRMLKQQQKTTTADELTHLCLTLHQLAQKYVPRSPQTFRDFDALTRTTRAMQKMGLSPVVASAVAAPSAAVEVSIVLNSPEYRRLHNRFVAALATIADMPEKNTPPGHPEYQKGVREGYRRASDIAILFLEDLHIGVKK
jgi:hypothetical protein